MFQKEDTAEIVILGNLAPLIGIINLACYKSKISSKIFNKNWCHA